MDWPTAVHNIGIAFAFAFALIGIFRALCSIPEKEKEE